MEEEICSVSLVRSVLSSLPKLRVLTVASDAGYGTAGCNDLLELLMMSNSCITKVVLKSLDTCNMIPVTDEAKAFCLLNASFSHAGDSIGIIACLLCSRILSKIRRSPSARATLVYSLLREKPDLVQ